MENVIWRKKIARYEVPTIWRSLWQLLSTLVLFGLAMYLEYWSLSVSYILTLVFAILASGPAIRIFIIMHDCGHGSFLPSRFWNDVIGWITGILSSTPYLYWRRTHAIHHANSGRLEGRGVGDIKTFTVREYLAASRFDRFKYRLFRNPLVMLGIGPTFMLIKHRWPGKAVVGDQEKLNIHLTNAALVVLIIGGSLIIGWQQFLLIWFPVMLISGTAGVWLFYVQHQFEDAYWRSGVEWNYATAALAGSSYYRLPKVIQWMTGNIGFHHIHHLSPKIPNYELERCHGENPDFQEVTTLTVWQSLQTISLKLWDEDGGRMVGFDHLRKKKSVNTQT